MRADLYEAALALLSTDRRNTSAVRRNANSPIRDNVTTTLLSKGNNDMWVRSRIEQQIIGAVLSGRDLPPEADLLRSRDLEHPLAGGILNDIHEARQASPGASTAEVIDQIAGRYTEFGVTAETMRAWCALPITDRELAGGIRMFLHLGADNEIGQHADAVKESLKWHENEQETRTHQRNLDTAITRRFETVDFAASIADPDRRQMCDRYGAVAPLPDQAPSAQRVDMEEEILAHLLETHGSCWVSANLINESSFSSQLHRDVFRSISRMDRYLTDDEDPFSATLAELIHLRRTTSRGEYYTIGDDEAILDRLGRREVDPRASPARVLSLGRELLVEDLLRGIETASHSNELRAAVAATVAIVPPALEMPQPPAAQQPQPRW